MAGELTRAYSPLHFGRVHGDSGYAGGMVLLAVVLATMAAPPELATAETAMSKYKYADALAALKKARVAKGLDRPSLLRILELQGIAAGQQRQSAQAIAAFTELLTLDPTHKLDGDFAPRVTTPFLEAGQTVTEQGALEPKPAPPSIAGRKVAGLTLEIPRDPLKQVRSVVFHFNAGAGWQSQSAVPSGGKATIALDAAEVSWWAELMGDNDAHLVLVGSEQAPIAAAPPPPPEVVKPAAAGLPPLRIVSFVAGGLGLAAAGTGLFFGARSSSTLQALTAARAQKDAAGNVIGVTERDALARGTQAASDGTIANALFLTAGTLVATGVVLFILGAPAEGAAASLTLTPTGLVFSGSFR